MNLPPELYTKGFELLLTVAAAWGSVKASLNGARSDIKEIKQDVKTIAATQSDQGERISRLEGTVDAAA